jgi:hypothetical protein
MDVLVDASGHGSTLCILGAGQLNDVDLDLLLRRYAAITLVDVDADTVRAALVRHRVSDASLCRVAAPVDLTGILGDLADGAAPSRLVTRLAGHRCRIPGEPFDVTASLGALSQLLQAVVDAELDPADGPRVALGVRDKHLTDLVHLTRLGGTCVLVTDVVSTTTAPELLRASCGHLEPQMASLVAGHNFFTGTNPYRIAALFEEDQRFSAHVTGVEMIGPWLWAVTKDRQHLTCAIVVRRRAGQRP